MAYDDDRPQFRALEELEDVLARVAEELAAWRRRAMTAEKELKGLGADVGNEGGSNVTALQARLDEFEHENAQLKERVTNARVQIGDLVARLGFLEQQALQETGGRT